MAESILKIGIFVEDSTEIEKHYLKRLRLYTEISMRNVVSQIENKSRFGPSSIFGYNTTSYPTHS